MLRSVKYGLHGAVLAGLAAAPLVWSSVDRSVQLVVDGRATSVHTTANRVGDVLHAAGYRVTGHDLVAPAVSATVPDGGRIVLRRGRLLHLTIDGRHANVWTTAPTVAQALSELGYGATDFVSVSRSRRLPLSPTDIAIRTPQLVTVVHDGTTQQVTTTDSTVGELLSDLQLTVGASDRVSPAPDAEIVPGTTVRIERVITRLVSRLQSTPYPTRRMQDASMFAGTTQVVHPGKTGQVRITYSVVYVDGRPVGETRIRAVTLAQPSARVVKVGTKRIVHTRQTVTAPAPVPNAPAPDPGTAKAIARELLAARGWGADQYDCLVTLWNHESGWRVHAANPSGAYGIPQALPGSKMGSAGPDWQNSAETQIKWGLGYIKSRYGTPCGAWSSWQANGGWY
ncbi:MAG TPA: ubiquitin-like domain-containing protein [Kineosporiaceae bacterium]